MFHSPSRSFSSDPTWPREFTMEYGGYLPLELCGGEEFYTSGSEYDVVSLNSGRVAIWYALQQFGSLRRVHLPKYYCPTVSYALSDLDFELKFYDIDEHLHPLLKPSYSQDEAVILVDYFGVMSDSIKSYATSIPNVVLDNCHAFFSPPLVRKGAYTVYSCRKFFGVADGAYLIGLDFPNPLELSREQSHQRMFHLLKSVETGTNSAYQHSVHNEDYVGSHPHLMSVLTERLLQSIDYYKVQAVRSHNFRVLTKELAEIQLLNDLQQDSAAYCYPLLCNRDIKQALVDKKVYVPTLWKHLLEFSTNNSNEYKYSKYLNCLPIDQRYTEEDIVRLAAIVRQVYTSEAKEITHEIQG